jgi:serine/threonine protein kinase
MEDFTKTSEIQGNAEKIKTGLNVQFSLNNGDIIAGRYEIISILGTGGSSIVYKCKDRVLKRELAIKVLSKVNLETEARFKREASLGTQFEHPNLLRVYDLGIDNSLIFITMPIAEGGTLAEKIFKRELNSFDELLKIVRQILSGLSFLHQKELVHRDIKPSNIFFDSENNVKIGDFNIIFSTLQTRYTSDGFLLGTPQYMSPEYLSGKSVTPASDLWSLGITIKETIDTLKDSKDFNVPEWFERWLSGLLQDNPEKRFLNADQALKALDNKLVPPHIKKRRIVESVFTSMTLIFFFAVTFFVSSFFKAIASPELIKVDGKTLKAMSAKDNLLWELSFPDQIVKVVDFGKDSKVENRFLVLYGGTFTSEIPATKSPAIAFVSKKGKIVSSIEPLKIFNPFSKDFSEDYFNIDFLKSGDFDEDGYQEALIRVRHNMYPCIIYEVSSLTGEITGALANSGHIYSSYSFNLGKDNKGIFFIGVNNRIGHQTVIIRASHLKTFQLSPDMQKKKEDYTYTAIYRPIGAFYNYDKASCENGVLTLSNLKNEKISCNSYGELFKDNYDHHTNNINVQEILDDFYLRVRKNLSDLEKGEISNTLKETRAIISGASDQYLKLFAQCLISEKLLQIGYPEEALSILPDEDKCANPQSMLVRKANILVLLKEYNKAKVLLSKAKGGYSVNPWYPFLFYSYSCILQGSNYSDFFNTIKENFPKYADSSAEKGLILQCAILSDDIRQGLAFQDNIDAGYGTMSTKYQDVVLFPAFYEIWRSFAQIALGMTPDAFPSEEKVKEAHSKVREFDYDLLVAFRDFKNKRDGKSLDQLEKSFLNLKKFSSTDSDFLLSYAISAYYFGFASFEMGQKDKAKEALKDALEIYPYGPLAKKARKIVG